MQDDWTVADAQEAGLLAAAPIPPQKDLRESWWTIGDQGSTGSCVGWATADSVVRWHMAKTGKLPASKTGLLSPRFVWMASKETDEFTDRPTTFIESDGTSLKAALDIARHYGTVEEPVLPFGSAKLWPGEANAFFALASQRKISAYVNLGRNQTEWRKWIALNGPILTRLDVDSTWMNATSTGGNLDIYLPSTVMGGHAVALVGYTPERFFVRNSWGVSWGKDGFGLASLAYARDAFTEAYGVKV